MAQDESDQASNGDQIIVTGSRIKRDGFNSPIPATVIAISENPVWACTEARAEAS